MNTFTIHSNRRSIVAALFISFAALAAPTFGQTFVKAAPNRPAMKAILNVPWRSAPDAAIAALKERDVVGTKQAVNANEVIVVATGGSFAGVPVASWKFSYYKEELALVEISFGGAYPDHAAMRAATGAFVMLRNKLDESYTQYNGSADTEYATWLANCSENEIAKVATTYLSEIAVGGKQPRYGWGFAGTGDDINLALVGPTTIQLRFLCGAVIARFKAESAKKPATPQDDL